jgi:hypothetical protein
VLSLLLYLLLPVLLCSHSLTVSCRAGRNLCLLLGGQTAFTQIPVLGETTPRAKRPPKNNLKVLHSEAS